MKSSEPPCLVLFDGMCPFCSGLVHFLHKRDRRGALYFVASQSEAGKELMRRFGLPEGAVRDALHAIEGGRIASRSGAVARIAARLALPWRLLVALRFLPASWRDGAYDLFSANRYRWFGERAECRVPAPEERSHFAQTAEELDALL